MLHITNGESVGQSLERSKLGGEVLTWDDVLHEGPAPTHLSFAQFSVIRAHFIADWYGLPYAEVAQRFIQRGARLTQFQQHAEVILWFEHDLYDQLQLIQLLDWFSRRDAGQTRLSLICINAYPGIKRFMGLGQLTPEQLEGLFDTRQSVTQEMLHLGKEAWKAFCAPTPLGIEAFLHNDSGPLPFVAAALTRHLEEFPGLSDGLSRTERQILELVEGDVRQPLPLFRAAQEKEDSPFMGDTTFWMHVYQLCQEPRALLTRADSGTFTLPEHGKTRDDFLKQKLALTADGQTVLRQGADWIEMRGGIDRWLGGTHLQGTNAQWRWDKPLQRISAGSQT